MKNKLLIIAFLIMALSGVQQCYGQALSSFPTNTSIDDSDYVPIIEHRHGVWKNYKVNQSSLPNIRTSSGFATGDYVQNWNHKILQFDTVRGFSMSDKNGYPTIIVDTFDIAGGLFLSRGALFMARLDTMGVDLIGMGLGGSGLGSGNGGFLLARIGSQKIMGAGVDYNNGIVYTKDTTGGAETVTMIMGIGGKQIVGCDSGSEQYSFGPNDGTGIVYINGVPVYHGSGTPEGAVTANVGAIYTDAAGGIGTTMYIKETGSGTNVGWVAVATGGGGGGGGIIEDVQAGAGLSASGTPTVTVSMQNVGTAGTYGNSTTVPIITTNAQGQVSGVSLATIAAVSSSLNSTQIIVGSSGNVATARTMSGDATMGNTGVLTLKNTGTAGTYGSATVIPGFTTDAQGRISAVTTYTITPGGSVNKVIAGTGLSSSGTNTVTVSMPNTGTAGTYGSATQVPVFTTDAQGRITAVTNTTITGGSGGTPDAYITVSSSGSLSAPTTNKFIVLLGAGISYAIPAGGVSGGSGVQIRIYNDAPSSNYLDFSGAGLIIHGSTNYSYSIAAYETIEIESWTSVNWILFNSY